MAIRVTCRACGSTFKVDDKYAGKRGRCPQPECSGTYVVPQPAGATERSSPARSRREPAAAAVPARNRGGRGKQARKGPSSGRWWIAGGSIALLLAIIGALAPFLRSGATETTLLVVSEAAARGQSAAREGAAGSGLSFETHALPFLKQHCADCHSGEEPEASISLAGFTSERAMLKQRKLFERIKDLIEQGVMPPANAEQPTAAEKEPVLAYLQHALYYIDCSQGVDPGRVTIRRLNRTEYNNTVRDLVGVNFKPAADFPADDVGYGFDNIGDVLSLPPLLMEKYLDAAESVAKAAILAFDPQRPGKVNVGPDKLIRGPAAHDNPNGVMLVSNGFVAAEFDAPLTGEYRISIRAGGQRGGPDLPRLELRVGNRTEKGFSVDAQLGNLKDHEHRLNLTRGKHRIAAAFTNDYYNAEKKEDRNLLVQSIEIEGPLQVDPASFPPFQREFLAHRPSAEVSLNYAVRSNLRPFLKRAFRRPVNESELDTYVHFVQQTMEQKEPFEAAMQRALTAILVSPHFLFRIETDSRPNDPTDRHPLNDYELATRLSYFLWSSLPDERLFALAERNELHRDDILESEIRRMLADPKSQALVENFAEQWLQLRVLNELVPDPEVFPQYSPELRADMQQETRQLFAHVMQHDRSLLELLDAKYTFVNERLARHYGMPNIKGHEFREVSLEGTPRSGLLTHASVMTMTSNPNRTSPVKRGKWIMEVILNTPPPPPPPNVPELEDVKGGEGLTFRQQLELHRENASCASCHRVMDELGFGLENFDAIGRYREKDGSTPLDVNGELPDGARFAGAQELAAVLRGKQKEFVKSLADKLLTYALGRGLEYYDRCTVNRIAEEVEQQNFRFSSLVNAIAKSEAFRMRRGEQVEN